jgi:hypothetical protein
MKCKNTKEMLKCRNGESSHERLKMQMPLRRQDTKNHKVFVSKDLSFFKLSALVPWWQKIIFPETHQILNF